MARRYIARSPNVTNAYNAYYVNASGASANNNAVNVYGVSPIMPKAGRQVSLKGGGMNPQAEGVRSGESRQATPANGKAGDADGQ